MSRLDFTKIKKIYFVGIKGVAMSGLAVICREMGIEVAGSDTGESFITDKILISNSIKAYDGFRAENVAAEKPDLAIIGTSWGEENPEVDYIVKNNVQMVSDSEFRGVLSGLKRTIAVTGVHGKTTTTALLAHVLGQAGLKPSYLVGTGLIPDLKDNAGWNSGNYFVVEGDEYSRSRTDKQPKFLDLNPAISIITSLEWEHVDIYPNLEAIESAFTKLIQNTSERVYACGDWDSIKKITAGSKKIVTFGLQSENYWRAADIVQEADTQKFTVFRGDEAIGEFRIRLFGEHNVSNALGVIAACFDEGITIPQIALGLIGFRGTQRRFELSDKNGVIYIDDYGHHPSEIKATLRAARGRYPDKKIYCVFQPHMASRTKALFEEFTNSFSDADKVIFADIFASARENSLEVNSKELAEAAALKHADAVYGGTLDQIVDYLSPQVTPGMVLLTMGAGDVYRVRDKLIQKYDQPIKSAVK